MNRKLDFTLLLTTLLLSIVLYGCSTWETKPTTTPTSTSPAQQELTPTELDESSPIGTETELPVERTPEIGEPAEIQPLEADLSEPELFWNQAERQAVAAAIDREALVNRVFDGHNFPAYHMVPSGYPDAMEPFLGKYGKRDLDLAVELLKGEGYTTENPLAVEMWYPPERYGKATAEVMQVIKEQLEESGLIQVEILSKDWTEYVPGFVDGSFPVYLLGWFPDFADPDNWISPFGSCAQSANLGSNYCNSTMEALLDEAAGATDTAERQSLYREIGELWAEDIPTLPLFWESEFVVMREGVEGVEIGSTLEFNYNTLRFGEDADPAAGNTNTIIIGTTGETNSLDAQDAYGLHDWEIIKNTGVPLLKFSPGTAELIPGAAVEFPEVSEDGKTYTFTLRDGIQYADGTPLTAQDYVTAWERLALGGIVSGLIDIYVSSVEAPDDQTVVYHLTDAYGFFPALTASTPFIPSNPNQFPESELVFFPEEVDGIGPYRMAAYVPGEQMELESNPKYFGEDKPIIPNVIVRYFSDPIDLSNAVEAGEVDIAWRHLGVDEALRLEDVEGMTVKIIEIPDLRFLVFNHQFMTGGGE
jgi:peptide/nickel transport system substrate-binding protein